MRISALVNHDAPNSIASMLTDQWTNPTVTTGVSGSRPTIDGGYPRSRVNMTLTHDNNNTGLSCGFLSGTRRTSDRVLGLRARDSATQTSGTSNSIVKFTAANQCTGPEDFAFIYDWPGLSSGGCATPTGSNFGNSITPGTSLTFCYTGDDPDISGDSNFEGISWRRRNLRTGAVTGATESCPENGDNARKAVAVSFPDRGAWVVEAELLDGDNCDTNQNPGFWFPIGTADVNSTGAPSLTLGATRPQFNGNTTVTATGLVDPDSGDGGGAQILEWDLDGNAGNGVAGYEDTTIAGAGATLASGQTKVHNTTGESPGLHTVRSRVTDNGAMDAADGIRRTSGTVTTTYLVDSAPVANGQSLNVESGNSIPITLTGSDPDSDPLTYSITDAPDNGSLTGSGPNRNYAANATFAGIDSFQFQVNDGFGRTATATVTIRVDPQTQIDASPPDPSDSADPSFSFSSPVTSAPVTFQCSLDSAGFTPCTSPTSYTGLSDDIHNFQVRAVAAGNTDPTPASYSWEIDTDPPTATIDTFPPDPSNDTTPEFTFSSDEDPGSTFECRLDSVDEVDFAPCGSPFETPVLIEGDHTFDVRAIDPAGNTGPIDSHTWTVDITAPVVQITVSPTDPSSSEDAHFEFTVDDPSADVECDLDGAGFVDCDSTSSQDYTGLDDGPHTFTVRATDPAGNVGDDARTWTIDSGDPLTTIDTFPDDPSNDTTPEFTFSSNESPDVTFECRLDSDQEGDFATCSSPYETPELVEGEHTLEVRATDLADNTGPIASYTWTVDTTAPVTTITDAPDDPTNSTVAHFEFSSDEDPDVTFECSLDGGPFTSCTSPADYPGLTEGTHTFDVRATDFAENVGTAASHEWRIDLSTPDTTITDGPPAQSTSTVATFEFDSDESPDVTFECRLDSNDPGAWEECSSPQLYADLSDGDHVLEVRAIDLAGNEDPTPDTHEWSTDTGAPGTTIDAGPSGTTASTDAHFEFSSDDPAATFECDLDDGGFAPCGSPQDFGGLDDGSHTFRVRAVDEFGNPDGTAATRTWVVDATGPVVTIDSAPADPTGSDEASFEFSADEAADFTCALDGGAPEPCDSPKSYGGVPEGVHTLIIVGVDSVGNAGAPVQHDWEVDRTPPDVTIDDATHTPDSSTTASFEFSSTDPDATFECRLDGGAIQGNCGSPRTYTGLDEGDHSFEVRATDDVGNASDWLVHDWTITGSDAPDTFIGIKPPASTTSTDADFSFSSNEPGSSFVCKLDSGGFVACDSSSEQSYSGLAVGSHTFRVKAIDTDLVDDPTPAEYTWAVTAVPVTPPPPAQGGVQAIPGTSVGAALVNLLRKVKLTSTTAKIGTVSCPAGATCSVVGTGQLKVKKKKSNVSIVDPGPIAGGASADLTINVPSRLKRGKLKVTVTVTPSGGTPVSVSGNIKLKRKKK